MERRKDRFREEWKEEEMTVEIDKRKAGRQKQKKVEGEVEVYRG